MFCVLIIKEEGRRYCWLDASVEEVLGGTC